MDEGVPSTSREIKTDNKSLKRSCTVEEKHFVAVNIISSEFPGFARFLGLEEAEIDEIVLDNDKYGFRETVNKMLVKWEQIKGCGATVQVLVSALNSIQRNDIVQHLFTDYYPSNQQPLKKLLQVIQRNRQNKYTNLMLPRTLWLTKKTFTLEEFYVELRMKKKDELGREEDVNIQREEIFHQIEIKNKIKNNGQTKDDPCRILIEGHPGYGKTTLISKLLFDWSREEKYMRDKFDLVFVIPLRNFKGNLENHLLQQIKNVNGSDEDKLKVIKEVEGRVLLLLDGLDECKERVKESLVSLFNGDQYPHMTVLVTSRTGFIHFEQESDENSEIMGNAGYEYHLIWDKRIQIKGISLEKRLEFLQKCLNINTRELEHKFERFNFESNNLYECPLFLLLFAVFALEGQKLDTIQTKTELYKRLVNFVLSRNLNRENLLEEEFDVFDDKVEDQLGCRNFLFRFGQLCLEKMKKQSLIFDKRELLECSGGDEIILKLGFVSKELNFEIYEEEEHYEPIHKSFLEFLAAFYLSFLNEAELKREIKELTLKYNTWPQRDQLLYPFLGGLLQENAYKLFNSFSPYTCMITIFKYCDYEFFDLEEILEEITENDYIYKSLIPFVPANWETFIYSPVCKRWSGGYLDFLQRKEISNNITLDIPYNLVSMKDSPVHVKTVFVHLIDIYFPLSLLETKEINCHNLIIWCDDSDLFDELKVVLSKIKAGKIFLKLFMECFLEEKLNKFKFYKLNAGKSFENFSIYHVQLLIKKTDLENDVLTLIEDLIERKKIETGIGIEFDSEDFNSQEVEKMNSFLDFVFKSHLTAVVLPNTGDKCITLKMNEKYWNYIKLSGNSINIKTNEINSFSVEHLDIRGLCLEENNWNWLKKCTNLKRLQCNLRLISEFNKPVFDDWFGFESLELLHIDHQYEIIEDFRSFLSVISRFKNLQEIRTRLCNCPEYLFKLLYLVPSVKKIFLCNTSLYDFFIALKFLEKKLSVMEERVEIEFRMNILATGKEIENVSSNHVFEIFEKCCLKNVFVSISSRVPFHILDINYSPMRRSMFDYFSSREGFQVFLTWEEDRFSPFELEFAPYTKINISCELPDNKFVK